MTPTNVSTILERIYDGHPDPDKSENPNSNPDHFHFKFWRRQRFASLLLTEHL